MTRRRSWAFPVAEDGAGRHGVRLSRRRRAIPRRDGWVRWRCDVMGLPAVRMGAQASGAKGSRSPMVPHLFSPVARTAVVCADCHGVEEVGWSGSPTRCPAPSGNDLRPVVRLAASVSRSCDSRTRKSRRRQMIRLHPSRQPPWPADAGQLAMPACRTEPRLQLRYGMRPAGQRFLRLSPDCPRLPRLAASPPPLRSRRRVAFSAAFGSISAAGSATSMMTIIAARSIG